MKKLFFFILTVTFLFSCKSKDAEQQILNEDSINAPFYWQAYLDDSTDKLKYRKLPANDTLTSLSIINFINTGNPNIKMEFVKQSNDTVFIRIPDAVYLTQQMGSTGPTLYMSEVVYNMTQVSGINEVNFDFEQGDHASPGTYNRNSFDNN